MKENKSEKSVPRTFHCNNCGSTIHRHEVFFSNCGKKLDHFDFQDE